MKQNDQANKHTVVQQLINVILTISSATLVALLVIATVTGISIYNGNDFSGKMITTYIYIFLSVFAIISTLVFALLFYKSRKYLYLILLIICLLSVSYPLIFVDIESLNYDNFLKQL